MTQIFWSRKFIITYHTLRGVFVDFDLIFKKKYNMIINNIIRINGYFPTLKIRSPPSPPPIVYASSRKTSRARCRDTAIVNEFLRKKFRDRMNFRAPSPLLPLHLGGSPPTRLPRHILPFFSRDYSLIGSLWIPPVLYEQRSLPVHAKYPTSLLPPFVSAPPPADAPLDAAARRGA